MVELTQPHDVLGQTIGQYLPEDAVLREMMRKSYDILVNHPINVERKKNGLNPANSCWFWGTGTKPALSSFEEKTQLKGAMISAVDLLKGIAVGASMKVVEVEGANGGLNTNYEGKAEAAIKINAAKESAEAEISNFSGELIAQKAELKATIIANQEGYKQSLAKALKI